MNTVVNDPTRTVLSRLVDWFAKGWESSAEAEMMCVRPSGAGGTNMNFCLTQQFQNGLWQLIRLRHHGGARLLQNLCATQVGGFHGEVSVLNSAA